MLEALKFVQGAIAKKDFVPALTHFRIHGGFVKGYNGSLGLCAPIDLDLDITPNAAQFIKAINACTETITLHVADNGKLVVRSGKLRTTVDCADPGTFPLIDPVGEKIPLHDDFLPALKRLEPFIALDASRPWACGILLRSCSAFATNNIVLVEYWLGFKFPVEVNIPHSAVKELLRVGEKPTHLQMTKNKVVFHFAGGKWISTQLFSVEWPDVYRILESDSNQKAFVPGFFEAVEAITPFVDEAGRCYFQGDRISTTAAGDLGGTVYEITGVPEFGCFNVNQLVALEGLALSIDFEAYPRPSIFYGKNLRGVIVGIRV